ncbi:tripartite tricarboxylate transporter substrate binding protein [Pseudooceanicola sp. 216_PA32_1]|uniref:Tripartite tricarboxylate transporter substrate binding protein n=1 Tax=Pseudooceanicola pacificus TaxID=2676438 RepID=A0A844WGH3_9RHOB|nr:tripartite tricarboxylate transporter substrate binding protein [Pseudooceanicola pacificus]MWB79139.1 tripartite tricarboxylate transporter substrate binding protein [Pseudooceanicola pacificus]
MKSWKNALAVVLAVLPVTGIAADFPSKPVTLVVPYPPGGNVDTSARIIAPKMEAILGQPIVVENRAGAGGMIAAEYVKNSDADGYTLFMAANGPLLFAPMTMNRPDAYDWKTDFAPVGSVSITPMALTVRKDVGITDIDELLATAGEKNLLMASPGAGTTNHLAAEKLKADSGGDFRIVHYKGNAPAIASLIGGETAFSFDQMSVILPYIKDGAVVPLAVTSSERVPALPDVPTLKETGKFDFAAVTFTGLLAPAGTPQEAIDAISAALTETLNGDDVKKRFEDLGSLASPMTPAEFGAFLTEIDDTWRPIVAEVNANK